MGPWKLRGMWSRMSPLLDWAWSTKEVRLSCPCYIDGHLCLGKTWAKNKLKTDYLGSDSTVGWAHQHLCSDILLRRMDFGVGVFNQGYIDVNVTMRSFKPKILTGLLCLSPSKWRPKERRDEERWINDQGFPHRTMCASNCDIVCCPHDGWRRL